MKTAKLDVADMAGMEAFLLKTDKETPVECAAETPTSLVVSRRTAWQLGHR